MCDTEYTREYLDIRFKYASITSSLQNALLI